MNDLPVRHEVPSTFAANSKDDSTESEFASNAPLSRLLKVHTESLHREAERSGVVRAILERSVTRDDYVLYLRNLHPIYHALERRLISWIDDEVRGSLADPALYRSRAIESDLECMAGSDWRIALPFLDSAATYTDAIESAGDEGLVAHAYVRYLGDLNGGLIVRRLLSETLGLGSKETAFYRFEQIPDIANARLQFRRALDLCAATCAAEHVVEHACDAFRYHIAMTCESLEASRAGVVNG